MAYVINALTGKNFAFSAHAGADIYRFPVLLKEKIQRADFVTTCVAANKDFLVSLGIAVDRIESISYGEEKPRAMEHNEAAWSQNRRDDFVLIR